jgi:hypothetical protein
MECNETIQLLRQPVLGKQNAIFVATFGVQLVARNREFSDWLIVERLRLKS